ncbi:hypothetical protein [Candidatus Albibeggiatoa sp. nov. NOAA]|uniref:hypothetical protein n=1 Tax=Candidatus Albibeggiatoa sp. nov. NOAA TaxID=3162724 RepID=UPI0032F7619B|nr:hypothetical protein [Thiotrichaceae bacterium]
MRLNFLLFSVLMMLNYNSYAKPCTVIGKIQATEDVSGVLVIRDIRQHELNSLNGELCAGDIVTVSESCTQDLVINYYSENLEQQPLEAGQQYEITGLDTPCGNWCKLTKKTKRLYLHLTRKNINPPKRIVATERGDNEDLPVSTLITDAQQPLYLFAENQQVSFFWKGGKAPYQLIVKDQQGQTVIHQNKLHSKHALFTLPNAAPNQTYQLILQDKQKKRLETKIVFRLPPFPLDPDENKLLRLTRLLLDTERNWRLEAWRQLQTFPDNGKVHKFKAHLIVNDF